MRQFSSANRNHPPLELDDQRLIKWLIVVGVLGVSIFLAQRATAMYLVVIAAAIGGLILLRWADLGLPLLVVGTLVVPFSLSTGTQTALTIPIILIPALLGIWLLEMIQQRNVTVAPSRVNVPLFGFLIAVTLSLLGGSAPWNLFAATAPIATQVAGWAVFALSIGVVLLVGNRVKNQRMLQIMVGLFLFIGALYLIGRLRVPLLINLADLMSNLYSVSSMFWVWLAALGTGQLLFNKNLSRPTQLFLAGTVALTVFVGFFLARDWASGWLPPLVAIGTIVWLRSWRLGVLCGIIGLVGLVIVRPDILQGILSAETGVESYSIMTRDVARQILVEQIFPLSPIIGLGPANYYWYTPLYPILGWYVKFNSHNNYVDILMQTGVVGFFFFAWVMAEMSWLGWRLRHHFKNDFAQGYVYACLGGIAGTLVACWLADWLLPFVYNIGLAGYRGSVLAWIFMGGLMSLEQIARQTVAARND